MWQSRFGDTSAVMSLRSLVVLGLQTSTRVDQTLTGVPWLTPLEPFFCLHSGRVHSLLQYSRPRGTEDILTRCPNHLNWLSELQIVKSSIVAQKSYIRSKNQRQNHLVIMMRARYGGIQDLILFHTRSRLVSTGEGRNRLPPVGLQFHSTIVST